MSPLPASRVPSSSSFSLAGLFTLLVIFQMASLLSSVAQISPFHVILPVPWCDNHQPSASFSIFPSDTANAHVHSPALSLNAHSTIPLHERPSFTRHNSQSLVSYLLIRPHLPRGRTFKITALSTSQESFILKSLIRTFREPIMHMEPSQLAF